jgi:hypothetical protein
LISLTTLFVFSIVIILIFALISNSGTTAITNIENQIAILNCPFPLFNGNDYLNGTIIYSASSSGTFYVCYKDPLSANPTTIAYYDHNYNDTSFGTLPTGWLHYIGDTLSVFGGKVVAIFTLISYVLTPINLDILGYTIADIGGVALIFIIGVYAFCYVSIGAWIYKLIVPFGGIS